jgi:diguanylate cyclase (GGDEF)-like protein
MVVAVVGEGARMSSHLDQETRITSLSEMNKALAQTRDAFLIQVRGPDLGKRLTLTETEVTIGRDPNSTIVLRLDSVSRYHARVDPKEGGHWVVDLQSTNGTYRNQMAVPDTGALLVSGDYLQIGDAIFKYLTGDNIEAQFHEEIYRLTVEDSLTRIPNKRSLMEFLDKEFARARRYQRNLSVVMIDLDHFKNVNDTYGHLTGDFVLREFAQLANLRIRREEILARYGGEEFACILPEMNLEEATEFAEAVRKSVEEHVFRFEGVTLRLTASLGVATMTQALTRPEALLLGADEALYRAKRDGRNRVCS